MRRPARQLPLELGHRTGLSREELIVTGANRQAAALVDGWPDWEANVVLLAGPAGSGKSHLAAIWAERAGARAAPAREIEAFLRGAEPGVPVLVDDADADPLDEHGLFHLMNVVREGGTHLLLTARRFPASWKVALPDLASRLRAVPVVEIREPDDLLLAGVITKLFADRQVDVEPHVVQFLVRRIERSLSTAMRVVDRLDGVALERQMRITRALAAEIVNAMDAGQAELDLWSDRKQ